MNQVQISGKLYDCRDTAQRFLRTRYKPTMDSLSHNIKRVAEVKKCSALEAATLLGNEAKFDDPILSVMILAAYVEMVEPSADAALASDAAQGKYDV